MANAIQVGSATACRKTAHNKVVRISTDFRVLGMMFLGVAFRMFKSIWVTPPMASSKRFSEVRTKDTRFSHYLDWYLERSPQIQGWLVMILFVLALKQSQ